MDKISDQPISSNTAVQEDARDEIISRLQSVIRKKNEYIADLEAGTVISKQWDLISRLKKRNSELENMQSEWVQAGCPTGRE